MADHLRRKRLLDDLRRIGDRTGAKPTRRAMTVIGEFHPLDYDFEFGSFEAAVQFVGDPPWGASNREDQEKYRVLLERLYRFKVRLQHQYGGTTPNLTRITGAELPGQTGYSLQDYQDVVGGLEASLTALEKLEDRYGALGTVIESDREYKTKRNGGLARAIESKWPAPVTVKDVAIPSIEEEVRQAAMQVPEEDQSSYVAIQSELCYPYPVLCSQSIRWRKCLANVGIIQELNEYEATESDLVHELENLVRYLGRLPSTTEYDRYSLFNRHDTNEVFGNHRYFTLLEAFAESSTVTATEYQDAARTAVENGGVTAVR